MCEDAATSVHSSLSEPNHIPAAAAISTICTADAVPLRSAQIIYLTFASEILDGGTRTLRFASAFLHAAPVHLMVIRHGLGL